ncbi:MAG: DUF4411 family protein [Bacillota bacterium]
MKDPKYVLDTNVFINMQRHHPLDVFGSLWTKMADIIDAGIVISCDEVFDELSIGNDSLLQWARQRKGAFISSGPNIQRMVREILQKYPTLVTGSRKSNGADPFVIALAKLKNCTLVSDETRAGDGQPVKIPNVCDAYGVRLIKFVDFLREVKISI